MITIQNLHFQYGKCKVFNGVSTSLHKGHVYGILGKNGTGKSTLLYSIAGLLKPASGSIRVNGYQPDQRHPDFLKEVFMVPEEFHLPDISIKSFVKYYAPFYPRFDPDAFHSYMTVFEMEKATKLQHMSYGQRKKVFISFGLASNVSVLLMDEPSNGLDIIGKSQLRKIIASAITDDKVMLISSHQVKDLENLIDEVVIMDNTKIVLKENLDLIASKLSFRISFNELELADALYTEPVLRGFAVVSPGNDQQETKVDLELLYKATMQDPERMKAVLTLND